jgi:hypothetical protein
VCKHDSSATGFALFSLPIDETHGVQHGAAPTLEKMNKYIRLKTELETIGSGKMKGFGNSMLPILKSGSLLTFVKSETYAIGDIVFCKVNGRFIDAHKIVKIDQQKGFLIANNKGRENGWTKVIFGKVIQSEYKNERKQF